jgi:hypothetical protein
MQPTKTTEVVSGATTEAIKFFRGCRGLQPAKQEYRGSQNTGRDTPQNQGRCGGAFIATEGIKTA